MLEITDTTWKSMKPSMGSPPFREGDFILSYKQARKKHDTFQYRAFHLVTQERFELPTP